MMNSTIIAQGERREIDLRSKALSLVNRVNSYLNSRSELYSRLLEEEISRKNVIRCNLIAVLWLISATFAEQSLIVSAIVAMISLVFIISKM